MTEKKAESFPRVAVLVLGYNDIEYLNDLFSNILKQKYDNFSVTFIDNASSDGSADFVKKKFPVVEVVRNRTNLGFSAAFNREMHKKFISQRYDAVIVMNSDMTIDDPFLIKKMVETGFSSSIIALVQPKIYLFNSKKEKLINTFGNEINYLGFSYITHFKEIDREEELEDRDIVAASGACLLIKKDFYRKAGGFDEDYFAYMEDADLSWRAHLLGMRSVLCAKTSIWHKYDFERQDKRPWKMQALERNRYLTLIKNYSDRTLFLLIPPLLLMDLGVLIFSITQGWFRGKVKSYFEVIALYKKMRFKKKTIQQNRIVDDYSVMRLFSGSMGAVFVKNRILDVVNIFIEMYYRLVLKCLRGVKR